MKKLRIIHSPFDMAGQAWVLSNTLKNLGHKSSLLVYAKNKYGYGFDYFIDIKSYNLKKRKDKISLLLKLFPFILGYGIFHFHIGRSLWKDYKDVPYLKALGKKIVVHFWGSELRQLDIAKKYKYHYAREVEIDTVKEEAKRELVRFWQKNADLIITSDFELQEYAPHSVVLPLVYDFTNINKLKPKFNSGKIKILHASTRDYIKGTKYIIPIVEKLKKEYKNKKIEFILVENTTHETALKLYSEADIMIDQILLGSYGVFSIESMALGKPVLCYIREDLMNKYPNLPIVSAHPDNLYERLKMLVENEGLRKSLGEKGIEYVRNRHDPEKVVKKLVELYERL